MAKKWLQIRKKDETWFVNPNDWRYADNFDFYSLYIAQSMSDRDKYVLYFSKVGHRRYGYPSSKVYLASEPISAEFSTIQEARLAYRKLKSKWKGNVPKSMINKIERFHRRSRPRPLKLF